MRRWLVLLALFPTFAAADIFKAGKDSYRRWQTPCSNPAVVAHIAKAAPLEKDNFRDGELVFQGKTLASCWLEKGGWVYSVDEKGDVLVPLPAEGFREDSV